MKNCKQCNAIIHNRTKIGDKVYHTQRRKFCLTCSPFGEHNTKAELRKIPFKRGGYPIDCVCQSCNRSYIWIRGKGGSQKQCNSCWTKKRRDFLKEKYKNAAGGCCQKCKYNKCSTALHFHHIDPATKLFEISSSYNMKKSRVEEELKKCVLICANCHSELHEGLWNIQDVLPKLNE